MAILVGIEYSSNSEYQTLSLYSSHTDIIEFIVPIVTLISPPTYSIILIGIFQGRLINTTPPACSVKQNPFFFEKWGGLFVNNFL